MLFATPAVAEDWKDAWGEYLGGDYQEAFRLFKRGAEQGDAVAQYNLGLKYAKGWGVPPPLLNET